MKKYILSSATALLALLLLNGCLALDFGGSTKQETKKATVGQQLIDLKVARDNNAISEQEYQAQKAKILSGK